jgi:hypothetical protein
MSAITTRIDASLVDDGVMADLTALCALLADEWVFTCGWRDAAAEQAGYDKWLADHTQPKFTNPANSAHVGANFPDGKSRAIDVTLVREGKDIWPDDPATDAGWAAFIAAVAAHPRLHGLSSIGDYDHAEKLDWQRDKGTA